MKGKITVLLLLACWSQCLAQANYTFTGVYTGKPRFNIETRRAGVVLGNVVVELYPNIAPKHTRNFDSLVSQKFYDTTAFHRCIPGFMIQGGDPNSRSGPVSTWGYGQPSQPTVPAEFTAARHLRGALSAARSANPNSATSQFFICVANYPSLNGQYSVYGRVVSGMNWVDTIAVCPKMLTYTNTPLQKVEMFVTRIGSNDTVPLAPVLNQPANASVDLDYLFPVSLNWSAVSDAVVYEVEVSSDSLFSSLAMPLVRTANLNYSFNQANAGTTYFWRVRSNNGGHFSPWSSTWKFSMLRDPNDPTGFGPALTGSAAAEVFPNPCNGRFVVRGAWERALVRVFDSSGKLVYACEAAGGLHEVVLPAGAAGLYTYRIYHASSETEGKVLVR